MPRACSWATTSDCLEGGDRCAQIQAGRRSIGLQVIFHANYLQLAVFELEYPRAMFNLVAVV